MNKPRWLILGALFVLWACKPAEPTTSTSDTGATATVSTTAATTDTGPAPAALDFPLDHYKIWRVKPVSAKGTVYLKGQFDEKEWKANLVSLQFLGNPTRKTITADSVKVEIKNEALHYDVYAIETAQPPPSGDVWVTNQFAKEELWNLMQPRWLLVPAAKAVIPPDKKPVDLTEPAGADHFVCYAAPARKIQRVLLLQDQFDRLKGPEDQEQIGELETFALCVPVEKRVPDKTTTWPINDKETHLALYKINPPEKYPISVWTKDQFGSRQLDVTNSELLAVPSHKRYEPKPAAKTSS
jgi:hypothetical protein